MSEAGMGLTRARDVAAVVLVAGVLTYLAVRWNYRRIPPLPTFAGAVAAAIGIGQALIGRGLRLRISDAGRNSRPPVEPLVAARAVAVAKASALAAGALLGAWLGVLIHVLPLAADVTAAAHDRTAALVGTGGAVMMLVGALFLERCCRTPDDSGGRDGRSSESPGPAR